MLPKEGLRVYIASPESPRLDDGSEELHSDSFAISEIVQGKQDLRFLNVHGSSTSRLPSRLFRCSRTPLEKSAQQRLCYTGSQLGEHYF